MRDFAGIVNDHAGGFLLEGRLCDDAMLLRIGNICDVSPVRVFRDVTRGDGVNYPTCLHLENLSSKLGINSPGTKVYV